VSSCTHNGSQGSPLNRSCAGQRPVARTGVAGPTPSLTCGFCSVGRRFTPVKWRAQTAVILSPFQISPGGAGVLRVRHVADVRFWARLRTQKRGDKGTDAGHVGDIASGASWTPLKITRPLRSSKVRKATWETPQSGLEISPVLRGQSAASRHCRTRADQAGIRSSPGRTVIT
jgi:hypothetical protein